MRRFELVEGTASKFWEIALEGEAFTVRFGRIGTDGQVKTKQWPSAAKAQAEHDKLVAEKVRKGYGEVTLSGEAVEGPSSEGTAALAEIVEAVAAAPPVLKVREAKRAPKPAKAAPIEEGDGWVPAGDGYALGVVDGRIVARNAAGKALASVPKKVKEGEAYEALADALQLLAEHEVACREAVEAWMVRSLPVPSAVLRAVWVDPAWRAPLDAVVIRAGGVEGILRAVEARGLGVVDLDGESRWIASERVDVPHPILLAELDDWRAMLVELGLSQGTGQLFRETFPKPPPTDKGERSVGAFGGGSFDMLAHATNEARKLGYRVSGGCAICPVLENGEVCEARYDLGDGDPSYETVTGELYWVDGRQRSLPLASVGPVAFSEGMRMASAIYAKRKIEREGEDA